jgi:hypothetical protein
MEARVMISIVVASGFRFLVGITGSVIQFVFQSTTSLQYVGILRISVPFTGYYGFSKLDG